MSYELKPDRPIGRELAQAIAMEIDDVIVALKSSARSSLPTRIHCARVSLKRIRAVLSLAKLDLAKLYRRLDPVYRDAGRKLSASRDAEVMVETLEKVKEKYKAELPAQSVQLLRQRLLIRRKAARDQQVGLAAISAELEQTLESLPKLEAVDDVTPGVQAVYRRGRKAFLEACEYPGSAAFHEWRKSVKRHLYHIEMVEGSLPAPWKAYRKSLKHLAEVLGDDHNLATLHDALPRKKSPLPSLIEKWQTELRAEAAILGSRIYNEKPRLFGERFHADWRPER